MNNKKPEAYKSELIENLIQEISSEEQKSTDRKMMLAARIYDAMNAKGMKKGQLAIMLKKKPSEVTKWLSGTHNFTTETLWEIGDALGIELINLGEVKKEKVVYYAYAKISQQASLVNYAEIMNKSLLPNKSKVKTFHLTN